MESDQEMEGERGWHGRHPDSSEKRAMQEGSGAAAGGQCRRRAFCF